MDENQSTTADFTSRFLGRQPCVVKRAEIIPTVQPVHDIVNSR